MATARTREIKYLIIHCADTDQDIGIAEVTRWHKKRGFATVGYHYLVRRDGVIEKGRPESAVGAHCLDANRYSIGICGVWRKKPTPECLASMRSLIEELHERYPEAEIRPHAWFKSARKQKKTCPNINLGLIVRPGLLPQNGG